MMNDGERPLRVLVVDDEPRYVRLLRLNLERHGFETLEAFTGIQAVEIAQRERPDLVLLDIETWTR
ncbi:MAG: response regulator, partial [Chloroflexi bacterium]|nr:response regulator [Chloroflexota bacterium]